jgi:hypothetical protein
MREVLDCGGPAVKSGLPQSKTRRREDKIDNRKSNQRFDFETRRL